MSVDLLLGLAKLQGGRAVVLAIMVKQVSVVVSETWGQEPGEYVQTEEE
jgi:hypothetical protein